MGGPDAFSISPTNLYGRLGTAASPLLFDVRRGAAFDAAETLIVGALRRDPDDVGAWQDGLRRDRLAVVYCAHGREISRGVAASLRNAGVDARYLEDGIVGWAERGLPCRNKAGPASRQWVTRARPKIDRIACPWLIRRFIDPEAQFLYVPTERVFAVAGETGATAYDIPGAEPFSHEGELCSFDALLKVYGIRDPALDTLALIVRGADTDRLELSPQSPGLLAFSLGLAANFPDDHAMLEHGMTMYGALYAWCRSLQGETHGWDPELGR